MLTLLVVLGFLHLLAIGCGLLFVLSGRHLREPMCRDLAGYLLAIDR